MRILLVDSGGPGFFTRYAYDVFTTLAAQPGCLIRQTAPARLSANLIDSFQPDLLLVLHGTFTPLPLVRHAKAGGAVTVLWLVEDPYEIDHHRGEMVNAYDYVFTNEKLAVSEYDCNQVYYLPWCCNPLVHQSLTVSPAYQSDLCFVGMGFRNRIRLINALAPQLTQLNVKLIGDWHTWGEQLQPDLQRFVQPTEHDFREVQKYYNGAKINLNLHRDPIDPPSGNGLAINGVSPNDRVFSLAGCGAFQMVDSSRSALWECFDEGTEIVAFDGPEDLGRKISYFLAHPEARTAIGKAAQQKAYAAHTFRHRLTEMFRIIGPIVRRSITATRNTVEIRRPGPVCASSFRDFKPGSYSTKASSGMQQ